jgi:hypothetical protein
LTISALSDFLENTVVRWPALDDPFTLLDKLIDLTDVAERLE